jgi:hypothetical protein
MDNEAKKEAKKALKDIAVFGIRLFVVAAVIILCVQVCNLTEQVNNLQHDVFYHINGLQ